MLTKLKEHALALTAIAAALAVLTGGYVRFFGAPPHAASSDLIVLAGREEDRSLAKQIARQIEIGALHDKCNKNQCSAYEKETLRNLLHEFDKEQRDLNRLRQMQGK